MKIVNWILAALAAAGVIFCAVTAVSYYTFPAEDYARQISDLETETEQVKADTDALERQLAERAEEIKEDLSRAGDEGARVQEEIARLDGEIASRRETAAALQERVDMLDNIYENTLALREEYAGKIRQLEEKIVAGESDAKICYWTFDDGPTYVTNSFLEAAAQYGAYVTFFTSREANSSDYDDTEETERGILRAEAMGGHSIQNHTYSHQYEIYGNVYGKGIDSFREMVEQQDQWVYDSTGFKPGIFRFPGGSAWAFAKLPKEEMLAVLDELGYVWVDWSCDIFDNSVANPDGYTAYNTAMYEIRTMNIAMILSHDWNAATLFAFQRAVPQLQEQGYLFLPLFPESWCIGNTKILFS